jgi:hypothetical protein
MRDQVHKDFGQVVSYRYVVKEIAYCNEYTRVEDMFGGQCWRNS